MIEKRRGCGLERIEQRRRAPVQASVTRSLSALVMSGLLLRGCSPATMLTSSPRTVTASLPARSTTSTVSTHHWVDLRSDKSLLCARDSHGQTYCWFLGRAPEPPVRFRATPHPVPRSVATGMAVSFPRTLLIRETGDVLALSRESAADVPWFQGAVELAGAGGSGIKLEGAPGDSTCARMPRGEVRCHLLDASVSVAVDTTAITVGAYHACGIRPALQSRTVACWGSNHYGQLGDGTRRSSITPVVVRGLADVIQLDAEHHSTCAVRADGKVSCWGLPGGSEAAVHSTPVLVPNLSNVAEVSLGERHLCARLRSGKVTCVGKNDRNQLGSATPSEEVGLSTIQGLDDVVKLTSLADGTCALRADDSIVCWGLGVPPESVSLFETENSERPDALRVIECTDEELANIAGGQEWRQGSQVR